MEGPADCFVARRCLLRHAYISPGISDGPMELPLREKIAGEIVLSESPGRTMRKWREELHISQTDLARHMHVSPSVISDYEAGRRTSPGIKTIHRLVDAFLEVDQRSGRRLS